MDNISRESDSRRSSTSVRHFTHDAERLQNISKQQKSNVSLNFHRFCGLSGKNFLIIIIIFIISKDIRKKCKILRHKDKIKNIYKVDKDGRKIERKWINMPSLPSLPTSERSAKRGQSLEWSKKTRWTWKRTQHCQQQHLAAVVEIHRHLGPSLPNAFQLRFLNKASYESVLKKRFFCERRRKRRKRKTEIVENLSLGRSSPPSHFDRRCHTPRPSGRFDVHFGLTVFIRFRNIFDLRNSFPPWHEMLRCSRRADEKWWSSSSSKCRKLNSGPCRRRTNETNAFPVPQNGYNQNQSTRSQLLFETSNNMKHTFIHYHTLSYIIIHYHTLSYIIHIHDP